VSGSSVQLRRQPLLLALLLWASSAWGGAPPCTLDSRTIDLDPDTYPGLVMIDSAWRLPLGYAPSDLVSVREAGFDSDHLVRSIIVADLQAMLQAARAAGYEMAVQSGYRSESYQQQVHQGWVARLGASQAVLVSARPGHSEHQLGTTIDLRSAAGPPAWELADWALTPEGAWISEHAPTFGFVMSYPRGAREATCYDYEPWHLRWVGRDIAGAVRGSGLALRAWLYLHHPPREANEADAP